MSATLSKEQIAAKPDLPIQTVEVPEWEGSVRMRTLSGAERDDFEQAIHNQSRPDGKMQLKQLKATLVSLCLVDEEGEQMFNAEELNEKSAKVLNDLFFVASKMNGIAAEEVDEMVKN